jgi:hypothetical protein
MSMPTHTIPRWDGRRVYYGSHLCKRFKRTPGSQQVVLDRFQEKSWQRSIRSPFSPDRSRLKHTVDSMNEWPDSWLEFKQGGYEVSWGFRREKLKPLTPLPPQDNR